MGSAMTSAIGIADAAKTPFRLLDLPDELILRVLSHAVTITSSSNPIQITSPVDDGIRNKMWTRKNKSPRDFVTILPTKSSYYPGQYPPITQVCRFLRREGQ